MINWKLLKTFGIILGILSILLALVVFSGDVGYYESNQSYNGDAYTGMQNASAQAANNVMYLGETLQMALAFFLIVQGLAMLLGALCIRTKQKPQQQQQVMQPVGQMPYQPQQVYPYQQQVSGWVCPQCGMTNAEGFHFCQSCGKSR